MAETDWQGLSDARFEKSATILELVESLADESLSLKERAQLRDEFRNRHGVTDRTIRNYIARFRNGGAQAFLATTCQGALATDPRQRSSQTPFSPSSRNGPPAPFPA